MSLPKNPKNCRFSKQNPLLISGYPRVAALLFMISYVALKSIILKPYTTYSFLQVQYAEKRMAIINCHAIMTSALTILSELRHNDS